MTEGSRFIVSPINITPDFPGDSAIFFGDAYHPQLGEGYIASRFSFPSFNDYGNLTFSFGNEKMVDKPITFGSPRLESLSYSFELSRIVAQKQLVNECKASVREQIDTFGIDGGNIFFFSDSDKKNRSKIQISNLLSRILEVYMSLRSRSLQNEGHQEIWDLRDELQHLTYWYRVQQDSRDNEWERTEQDLRAGYKILLEELVK